MAKSGIRIGGLLQRLDALILFMKDRNRKDMSLSFACRKTFNQNLSSSTE